jgi:signal transduction histidine kinase/ActR/RegA family two-component response regulator
VADGRHFLGGRFGLPASWAAGQELDEAHCWCRHVVASGEETALADAQQDARFRDDPAVAEIGLAALLAVPLVGPAGDVVGCLGVAAPQPRDWTEAERGSLRDLAAVLSLAVAAEDRLEKEAILLAHIPYAFFVLDEEGRITYLNGHAEHLFRQLSGSRGLLGKVIWAECPEVADSTFARECREARAENRDVERESFYPTLERWVAVHVYPCGGELCVSLRDVTERTRLQRAVLQRAEDLAEADRGKDEFLIQLIHEVRNGLAPMRNALHLTRDIWMDGEEHDSALALAEQEVRRLSRLMDDLQKVSELTPQRLQLQLERVNLAEVVARALAAALASPEASGHNLTVSLPPEPLYLEADPRRLEQVLLHLLDNAFRFTRPGGHIRVRAERQGNEAVLRVADDGVGMTPEMLTRVFNLFMRSDRALSRLQGGLGIGLTLVRRLVERHQGTVTAHSAGPGQGTEIVVRLPAPVPVPAPQAQAGSGTAEPAGLLRVLVVDDSKEAAQSVAFLLRRWGHDVRVVYDGQTALDEVQARRPEVVLLDIGMPGMDGYEVARRLRQSEESGKLLLIALTGYGQEEERERARQVGFDYHLLKPVEPVDLQNLLRLAVPASATASP